MAFNMLKIAGAMYLLYLAWHAFKADATNIREPTELPMDFRKFYYQGVIMNITNPIIIDGFLPILSERGPKKTCPAAMPSTRTDMIY